MDTMVNESRIVVIPDSVWTCIATSFKGDILPYVLYYDTALNNELFGPLAASIVAGRIPPASIVYDSVKDESRSPVTICGPDHWFRALDDQDADIVPLLCCTHIYAHSYLAPYLRKGHSGDWRSDRVQDEFENAYVAHHLRADIEYKARLALGSD